MPCLSREGLELWLGSQEGMRTGCDTSLLSLGVDMGRRYIAVKTDCDSRISPSVKDEARSFHCICIKTAFSWLVSKIRAFK